jgi:hypothetical protein
MGTILNTKCSLNALASEELPVRKSITPFIIHEELLSPGCTLALMKTPFLAMALADFGSLSFEVIVIYSQRFPAKVRVRVFLAKKLVVYVSFSILVRSSCRSEYV